MATGVVYSLGDGVGVVSSLEKKAWLVGRFLLISVASLSFDQLEKHLDRRRKEVETVLRLSKDGLSWGDQGRPWRLRFWNRTVPFESVELFALYDIFQDDKPEILICIAESKYRRDFYYEVFAFRLYDGDDVRRFQRLFRLLTTGSGSAPGPRIGRGKETSGFERRALRRLVENDAGTLATSYGERTRRGANGREHDDVEPVSANGRVRNNVAERQNQAEDQSRIHVEVNQSKMVQNQAVNQSHMNKEQTANQSHMNKEQAVNQSHMNKEQAVNQYHMNKEQAVNQSHMNKEQAVNQSHMNKEQAVNQSEMKQEQTVNQRDEMQSTQTDLNLKDGHERTPETNQTDARPVPAPRRSKLLLQGTQNIRQTCDQSSSSDSEFVEGHLQQPEVVDSEGHENDGRENETAKQFSFVWTQNLAFDQRTLKAKQPIDARRFDSDEDGIEFEGQTASRDPVTFNESTLGEVKVVFRDDDVDSAKTSTVSDVNGDVTPTSKKNFSDGRVSVIVPDYSLDGAVLGQDGVDLSDSDYVTRQNGVRPKSLLKTRGSLESEPEPEVGKRKKVLSFNPSVAVKGSSDRPDVVDDSSMTVTVHRTFRRNHSSATADSAEEESSIDAFPLDPRHARPALVRGISLPVDAISGPFVTSNAARVRGHVVPNRISATPEAARVREISWSGRRFRESGVVESHRQMAISQSPEFARNTSKNRNSAVTSPTNATARVSYTDAAAGAYGKSPVYNGQPSASGKGQTPVAGSPHRWWNFWRRSRDPPLLSRDPALLSRDQPRLYASDSEVHERRRRQFQSTARRVAATTSGAPGEPSTDTDSNLSAMVDAVTAPGRRKKNGWKDGRTGNQLEDHGQERPGELDHWKDLEREEEYTDRRTVTNRGIGRNRGRHQVSDGAFYPFPPASPPIVRDHRSPRSTALRWGNHRRHQSVIVTGEATSWPSTQNSNILSRPVKRSNSDDSFGVPHTKDPRSPVVVRGPVQTVVSYSPAAGRQTNPARARHVINGSPSMARPQFSNTSQFQPQRHSYLW